VAHIVAATNLAIWARYLDATLDRIAGFGGAAERRVGDIHAAAGRRIAAVPGAGHLVVAVGTAATDPTGEVRAAGLSTTLRVGAARVAGKVGAADLAIGAAFTWTTGMALAIAALGLPVRTTFSLGAAQRPACSDHQDRCPTQENVSNHGCPHIRWQSLFYSCPTIAEWLLLLKPITLDNPPGSADLIFRINQ
jgi:hypothetical protein